MARKPLEPVTMKEASELLRKLLTFGVDPIENDVDTAAECFIDNAGYQYYDLHTLLRRMELSVPSEPEAVEPVPENVEEFFPALGTFHVTVEVSPTGLSFERPEELTRQQVGAYLLGSLRATQLMGHDPWQVLAEIREGKQ